MDFLFLRRKEEPQKTMAVLVAKAPEDDRYLHRQKGCGLLARSWVPSRRYGREELPGAGRSLKMSGVLTVSDGSGRYVVEYSPVGASQERAIQSVSGQRGSPSRTIIL